MRSQRVNESPNGNGNRLTDLAASWARQVESAQSVGPFDPPGLKKPKEMLVLLKTLPLECDI